MTQDEKYSGWTNRETWAVALHINNDQGWQESVLESLRTLVDDNPDPDNDETLPYRAAEIIRENVEEMLDSDSDLWAGALPEWLDNVLPVVSDIGSLWRVDWTELGRAFLDDLAEQD